MFIISKYLINTVVKYKCLYFFRFVNKRTNVDAVNTWVETTQTTHSHAKMRQVLAQKIKQAANSVHKETTKGAKSLHNRHVKSLVSKLNDYGVEPFEGVAKELSTGKEIDIEIITDMINADVLGTNYSKSL